MLFVSELWYPKSVQKVGLITPLSKWRVQSAGCSGLEFDSVHVSKKASQHITHHVLFVEAHVSPCPSNAMAS